MVQVTDKKKFNSETDPTLQRGIVQYKGKVEIGTTQHEFIINTDEGGEFVTLCIRCNYGITLYHFPSPDPTNPAYILQKVVEVKGDVPDGRTPIAGEERALVDYVKEEVFGNLEELYRDVSL